MSMKDELLNLLGRLGRAYPDASWPSGSTPGPTTGRNSAPPCRGEADGVLIRVKKNYYAVRGRARLVTGKLQCHRSGFDFVIPDPECHPGGDVYVRAADLGDATHGDRVAVSSRRPAGRRAQAARPGRSGPRLEGRILHVLERGTPRIIGRILVPEKAGGDPAGSRGFTTPYTPRTPTRSSWRTATSSPCP